MTKREREIVALLRKAGAARIAPPVMTGGTHLCVRVHAPNGVARKFFTSFTPSDRRANLNILANVRQFCRQNSTAERTMQ